MTTRGYQCGVFDNPVKGGGPFLVAERTEDAALPTLLTYGHGDVVRGKQWRDGLDPWTQRRRLPTTRARNPGRRSGARERGRHRFN